MNEKISCFSAIYRDEKVYVSGKTYPAGYFAVQLLNELYSPLISTFF